MHKTEFTVVLPSWAMILERDINRSIMPTYLTKIINKSTSQAEQAGVTRLLMRLLTQAELSSTDLPMAHWLTEQQNTILADPCYLHPDRDRLLLFAKDMVVTHEESKQLIAEIQPLLEEVGQLSVLNENQWQLTLSQQDDVYFTAIEDVEGRSVDAHLPTGKDRRKWVKLWNEIQMQLYQSDVNQQRMQRHQQPINSVWFWGAGGETRHSAQWDKITGQHPSLTTLMQSQKENVHPLSQLDLTEKGQQLIVLPELDLEKDWQQQISRWDEVVFKPLWQRLSRFSCQQVTCILPQLASYHITPKQRWWKR